MPTHSFDDLVRFAAGLFMAYDVPAEHADTTARRLVEADFRGRTGHGLIRAVPYLDRIAAGGINVHPDVRVLAETPTSAQVDGDNGLGQVTMTRAAELAAAKAEEHGVAVVGTVHSNHAGAAGLYPLMLAERGLVGIYFAVANAKGMPPWGGRDPILGTNPIAVAVPAAGRHPYLLDIATTTASHGSIKVARLAGQRMPEGWVVDPEGQPITDPSRADEGFLVPIGGHKGSGLTMAIGLLAGTLNGAAFGRAVVDHRVDTVTPTNTGQLLIGFRADLFRPLQDVLGDVADQLDELRAADPQDGSAVRLPGDRAAEAWTTHRRDGLEVEPHVLGGLLTRAAELGVATLPTPPTSTQLEESR